MYSQEFSREYRTLGLVRESQFRNSRRLVMDKVQYPVILAVKGLGAESACFREGADVVENEGDRA
jgi:hypothetical protein